VGNSFGAVLAAGDSGTIVLADPLAPVNPISNYRDSRKSAARALEEYPLPSSAYPRLSPQPLK